MLFKSISSIFTAFLFFATASAQTCIPTVTVQHGFAVNIHPIDSDGDGMTDMIGAQIRLSDLVVKARNHCDSRPLKLAMRKAGEGIGMPADTMLTFDCSELGKQNIEVWVRNAMGRMNFSVTFVDVQDNYGDCIPEPFPSAVCSPDVLAPEILLLHGLAACVRVEGSNLPSVTLEAAMFVKAVYDNCSGPFEYRIRKAGQGTGTPNETSVTFDCSELGKQNVDIWVGDPSGNWSFTQSFVEVQDNWPVLICLNPLSVIPGCSPDQTSPLLVVLSGLSQPIAWPEGGKKSRVYASDFVRVANDACSPATEIRIRKAGQGAGVPPAGQTELLFPCSELGQQNVEIWLLDAAGNWTMVITWVYIQDNTGNC